MTTPMAYTIRSAVLADIPAMGALLTALNRFEGHEVITDEDALAFALFAEGSEVDLQALVAEDADREILGTLLYYPGYDTLSATVGYHLADIVVGEAHRRRGVGRAMIEALCALAMREDKRWVSLAVLQKNLAAQAFYKRLGMTTVPITFMAMGATTIQTLVSKG